MRCRLGIEENEIACFDEAGQPQGDYRALAAALAAAEVRLRELEAEVRRLRGEAL